MDQDEYYKLISGERGGLGAGIVRVLLRVCSVIYCAVVGVRNFLYSVGGFRVHRAPVPVVCVGNITTGGTGKTPAVIWLCREITTNCKLRISNSDVAILTRGYKSGTDGGDEPAVLAELCPGVTVVVNPDRVAGAAEAVERFGAKVLIMDDGFQHRRLFRDVDIVTVDAMRPFGYGRVLPAGLLREPVSGLKRAHAVVITRCDQVEQADLASIEERLRLINPDLVIARSVHAPVCARDAQGKEIALAELEGKKVFGFCGIGNPEGFFGTISGLGAELVDRRVYNDHYHYTEADIAEICGLAERSGADFVLTTHKDWTKAGPAKASEQVRFAYLAVELRITSGHGQLKQLITDALAGKIPSE